MAPDRSFRFTSKAILLIAGLIVIVALAVGLFFFIDREDTALPEDDNDYIEDPNGEDPDIEEPVDDDPDVADPAPPTPADPAKPKPPYVDDPDDKEDDEKEDEKETWYVLGRGETAAGTGGAVSSMDYRASKIAARVLKEGGNAFDAAVALGLALNIYEPNMSGLGGVGLALTYHAETDTIDCLMYRGIIPLHTDVSAYQADPGLGDYGMPAGIVPATLKAYIEMMDRYGTKSFAELAQPTIDAAREGVTVGPGFASWLMGRRNTLARDPETASIYTPDGFPLAEGQTMYNPMLADLMERLVEEGPESFYTGSIAEDIVEAARAHGSYFTLEDFATVEATWVGPLHTNYRGYDIYTSNIPSHSITALTYLNVLERYDIPSMPPDSPDKIHYLAETSKFVRVDRGYVVGDPNFYDSDKAFALLSEGYASAIADKIDLNHASRFQPYMGDAAMRGYSDEYLDEDYRGTTHYSIVDKDNNIVLVTQTLGPNFGSGMVVPGTGFLLNRWMDSFNFSPGSLAYMQPGQSSRSTSTPTFIKKDGKILYALGTPGAARIPDTVTQVVSNLIDHKMSMDEAVDFPRFHAYRRQSFNIEPRFDPRVIAELTALGHNASLTDSYDRHFGRVNMVAIDWDSGLYKARDDKRAGDSGSVAIK